MKYLDYINVKLSRMSDSELQNFSEQHNFNLATALLKGGKGFFKGVGTKQGAFRRAKQAFKSDRNLDKYVEKMWGGSSLPVRGLNKSVAKSVPTGSNIIPFKQIKAGNVKANIPAKIETPKDPFAHVYAGGGAKTAENTLVKAESNAGAAANTTASTANVTANTVAKSAEEVAKEGSTLVTKFSSPAEAVAANKTIQKLDQKILDAVSRGDVKVAANLRKLRTEKARKIEDAYNQAYNGKFGKAVHWANRHKLASVPLGLAGAGAAGAVATTGAATVWGANKVADTVFD